MKETEIKTGCIFSITWIGMTVTSRSAECWKSWELINKTENNKWLCKLVANNTAMGIPANCTKEFSEDRIIEELNN